ncbi:MAG: endonuclease III domain-containing protein [bacterium]
MWKAKLNEIIDILKKEYCSPHFNNKSDIVSEIIYIILSKRTNYKLNNETYNKLLNRYNNWEEIQEDSYKNIKKCIYRGGLSEEKSKNIKKTIAKLYEDFNTLDINDILLTWSDKDVKEYLVSLPGIGLKSAYCVMLFSLKISVQPADTHIIKLFNRLGFIDIPIKNHSKAQKKINIMCKDLGYEKNYYLHVNFKAHGQEICKRRSPNCESCIISGYCCYYKHKNK